MRFVCVLGLPAILHSTEHTQTETHRHTSSPSLLCAASTYTWHGRRRAQRDTQCRLFKRNVCAVRAETSEAKKYSNNKLYTLYDLPTALAMANIIYTDDGENEQELLYLF